MQAALADLSQSVLSLTWLGDSPTAEVGGQFVVTQSFFQTCLIAHPAQIICCSELDVDRH